MEQEVFPILYGGANLIFKIIGSAIVIISAVTLGILKSDEYENRVRYLESMQLCILQLENEMRYVQTPIFDAMKKISANAHITIAKILCEASKQNSSGETVNKIWAKSVKTFSKELFCEDIELFLSLGECLGNTDLEGQIKSINLFETKLNQVIQKAQKTSDKNKKLYKNLGLYSGILIAVFFL